MCGECSAECHLVKRRKGGTRTVTMSMILRRRIFKNSSLDTDEREDLKEKRKNKQTKFAWLARFFQARPSAQQLSDKGILSECLNMFIHLLLPFTDFLLFSLQKRRSRNHRSFLVYRLPAFTKIPLTCERMCLFPCMKQPRHYAVVSDALRLCPSRGVNDRGQGWRLKVFSECLAFSAR